jgi:hypothetical protein
MLLRSKEQCRTGLQGSKLESIVRIPIAQWGNILCGTHLFADLPRQRIAPSVLARHIKPQVPGHCQRRADATTARNATYPASTIPKTAYPIATSHTTSARCGPHTRRQKPTDVWRAVEVGAQIGAVYEHAGDRCRTNHEWASSGWRRARRAPPMSPMKICIAVAVARFVCGETFSAGQESNSAA